MSHYPERVHVWRNSVNGKEWKEWSPQYNGMALLYGEGYVRADIVAEKDAEIANLRQTLQGIVHHINRSIWLVERGKTDELQMYIDKAKIILGANQ